MNSCDPQHCVKEMAFLNHTSKGRAANFQNLVFSLPVRHLDCKISTRLKPCFGSERFIDFYWLILVLTCTLPQLLNVNLAESKVCV